MAFPLEFLLLFEYTVFEYVCNGKSGMSDELTGIMRAVTVLRTQAHLAELLSQLTGDRINQSRVSTWIANGYVPRSRAAAVSQVSGIPVTDLVRKTPRRNSRGKKS